MKGPDLVDDLQGVWNALGYRLVLRALTSRIDGSGKHHDSVLYGMADACLVVAA